MLSFEVQRERANSSHICYYIFIMNIIVVPLPQCKDVVGTLHVSFPLLRINSMFVFVCFFFCSAPCIITYWRYGRWLGAVNCPVCRQQVRT